MLLAEAARCFALVSPVGLIVRAVNSESATRPANRLATRRRHHEVAIMDGMVIGRALRFLRSIVNPLLCPNPSRRCARRKCASVGLATPGGTGYFAGGIAGGFYRTG